MIGTHVGPGLLGAGGLPSSFLRLTGRRRPEPDPASDGLASSQTGA